MDRRTVVFFGFFFSSRRRHTRCLSDWSSDVCSSDLPQKGSRTSRTPWPESDILVCCSCRLALIVFQQAAQPLPAPHLFLFSTDCLSRQREWQYVVFALVISFLMIVGFVVAQRAPQ